MASDTGNSSSDLGGKSQLVEDDSSNLGGKFQLVSPNFHLVLHMKHSSDSSVTILSRCRFSFNLAKLRSCAYENLDNSMVKNSTQKSKVINSF